MKTASKEVQMTVEKHDRSGYRAEVHPVLVSFLAQEGLTDAEIASRLKISRRTLYTWRKGHPELEGAMKDSKELANARVEAALFQKALQGDVSACVFFLCNRSPSRWSRNGQVEVHINAPAERGMSLEEVVQIYSDAYGATEGVEAQIAAHVGKERTDANVCQVFTEAIRTTLEGGSDCTPKREEGT